MGIISHIAINIRGIISGRWLAKFDSWLHPVLQEAAIRESTSRTMPKISLAKSITEIPPVPSGLSLLSKLSDSQVEIIFDIIKKNQRFDIPPAELSDLRKRLELSATDDIGTLLASLEFLYRQGHTWSGQSENWRQVLKQFLRTTGLWEVLGENPESTFAKLLKLLFDNEHLDSLIKREWLESGVVDKASSFSSFVDLRPNFSQDRKRILELIPMIIFSIETQSDSGDSRSIVFQMTRSEFAKFSNSISDIEKKLEALKTTSLSSMKIAPEEPVR